MTRLRAVLAIFLALSVVTAGGLVGAKGTMDSTADSDDADDGPLFDTELTIEYMGVEITFGPPTDPNGDGIYKDVTGDGELTFMDALTHMAVVLAVDNGAVELTDEQAVALDINGDGVLDLADGYELFSQSSLSDQLNDSSMDKIDGAIGEMQMNDSEMEQNDSDAPDDGANTPEEEQNDSDSVDDSDDMVYDNATEVENLSDIPNGELGSNGEADVYAFDAEEGSEIYASQGIGGGAFPVTLIDDEGNVIDRIENQEVYTGDEFQIYVEAPYTGTYYLKLDGEANDRYSILDTAPNTSEPADVSSDDVDSSDADDSDTSDTSDSNSNSDSSDSDSSDDSSDSSTDDSSQDDSASVDDGAGDDLNCEDFDSVEAAQENADSTDDENNLDGDADGEACEGGVDS